MVILTTKEAAELLKCTRQCIWARVRANRIPYFRIGRKGAIRFEKESLIRWAEERSGRNL
jgi:excisionase family DNA binding protein